MIWWYHYCWKHPCLLPGGFSACSLFFFFAVFCRVCRVYALFGSFKTESSKATKFLRWLLGVAKKRSYPNTIRYHDHEIIYSFKGQICRKKRIETFKNFPKNKNAIKIQRVCHFCRSPVKTHRSLWRGTRRRVGWTKCWRPSLGRSPSLPRSVARKASAGAVRPVASPAVEFLQGSFTTRNHGI